ncbi:haloacid dehalogenase [Lacimicrobium alkaliphilum]|uniref:Haloacid dehalogenase n=2 Tax=Lacimicrobium alkaliphilum TaxID=1526571 RepID=A0ABQ1RRA4_9ALTE|nr:haloacid dehalogenase [Lacimicrobium alkaliphilum]
MLPWKEIDTVLLDMDGTLLDLHFDNHFWQEYVPAKLAERDGLTPEQAREYMRGEYARVTGTIDWYCLDYWADKLQMDIVAAKREIQHLISMREDTLPFLDALRETGKEVILVTNAHPQSLSLKVERTQLDQHIDTLISTHEFGVTKESQLLWQKLQQRLGFEPARTLFVDDSLNILHAAQEFGIAHLLAVQNPDSKLPVREIDEFVSVQDYRYLLDDIHSSASASGN